MAWKLTGFIFAFGLLLTYVAFLSFGRVSTRLALRVSSGMAASAFRESFGEGDRDCLSSIEGASEAKLFDFERGLPFLSSPDAFRSLRVYGRESNGRWFRFSWADGERAARGLATADEEEALESIRSRRVIAVSGFDPLSVRALPAYLALPTGPDGTEWAIGADVDAAGIKDYILDNGRETLSFAVLLVVLSLALSHAFARRFTKPIVSLAGAARAYGDGAGPAAFDMRRRDEIGELAGTLSAMAGELERRKAETESRLATMEAMNRIDKAVLTTSSRSELLSSVAAIIDGILGADVAAIALREPERGGWSIGALSLASGGVAPTDIGFSPFVPDATLGAAGLERFTGYSEFPLRNAGPVLASVASDLIDSTTGVIVSVPLRVDGVLLGALIVASGEVEGLSDDERRTVTMLADQAAVALRSILERESREDNFIGIIRSLTRAIDAKSKWTSGHSERVSDGAVALASALGLQAADVASLRIAANLHDVGKIGVAEAILDKPGRLTPEEFEQIRSHPAVGAAMLEGIRSFKEIVPAVLRHHERWNGTGYPDGLAGEDIPLAARIIAVADVWDAIRDDRPYRAGMPLDEAIRFMRDGAGTMFDPRIVDVFLEDKAEP